MIRGVHRRDRTVTAGSRPANCICPTTIGRAIELAALQAFLGRPSGLLLLSGEAGIGKSRLVREARSLAYELGIRVLEGRCFEADSALPFAPALDILRSLIDCLGAAEVIRLAGSDAPQLARLLPELSQELTGIGAQSIDGEMAKRRLLNAFARLLTEIADEQPLLVIVEDIHWPDASSLDLLLHLARRSSQDQLYILLTYRGDEVHPDLAHFLATIDRERLGNEMCLDRFDACRVASMLQTIFGIESPVPADLLQSIFSLTDGNPFFIEEVLTVLGTDRRFVTKDDGWTREDLRHPRIPRSIYDAVQQRLKALDSQAREVLVLAAVAGRRFEFDLFCELSGLDETDLLDLMKMLIAARLVVEEPGDRFAFRHALTREAIYSGLLDRERRRLHRRLAEAIERLSAAAPDTRLDELAVHYFAARSWAQVLDTSLRAGLRAADLHAPRAAVEQLSRAVVAAHALGLPPQLEIHQGRGRAYETLGEFEHAIADYELALSLAREAADRQWEWQILLDLSLLWASRDYLQSGRFATLALEAAQEIGEASESRTVSTGSAAGSSMTSNPMRRSRGIEKRSPSSRTRGMSVVSRKRSISSAWPQSWAPTRAARWMVCAGGRALAWHWWSARPRGQSLGGVMGTNTFIPPHSLPRCRIDDVRIVRRRGSLPVPGDRMEGR